jgi:hypothetical protein
MSSDDDRAKYARLAILLTSKRTAKNNGFIENMMEHEQAIRLESNTIGDPKLKADLLKQCDDLRNS